MKTNCRIKSVSGLNRTTIKVILKPVTPFSFRAGQYLNLCVDGNPPLTLSIASAPALRETDEPQDIEVHIGGVNTDEVQSYLSNRSNLTTENSLANAQVQALLDAWQSKENILIEGPFGHAWLRENSAPLVLIAGGSGYTYIRSLLLRELCRDNQRPVTLYWGARTPADLYHDEELLTLAEKHSRLSYISVAEEIAGSFSGKRGRLLDIVYDDNLFYQQTEIYLCGRYEMVQSAFHHMTQNFAIPAKNIYSDALPTGK
ncbi:hypothetical protein [Photobacterium sp. J15]|uniref:hypothetical protein n=1 Tax=Photobacterium sp. J15 TaxID=265901 RepID=UPI0007E434EB|nr:hypothetical protein [Photobacterium sp. J15]